MSFDGDFDIKTIVRDFASGLRMADEKRPQAKSYRPGIGPIRKRRPSSLLLQRCWQYRVLPTTAECHLKYPIRIAPAPNGMFALA